jgi:hypothetical protein
MIGSLYSNTTLIKMNDDHFLLLWQDFSVTLNNSLSKHWWSVITILMCDYFKDLGVNREKLSGREKKEGGG